MAGKNLQYVSHTYIKSCLYLTNISPLWIWEIHENPDLSPLSQNRLHFELWTFGLSKLFGIFFWDSPLKAYSDLNEFCLLICLRQGRGRTLWRKGPNETQSHLYDTNFGALNNLLQKELLIRALYTHLNLGGRGIGKETKSAQNKKWKHWAVIYFFHTIQIKKKKH